STMEHAGEYPHALADQMQKMGLFGLNTPEEFGGTEVDYVTFARIFTRLARTGGDRRDTPCFVRRPGPLCDRGTEAPLSAGSCEWRSSGRNLPLGTRRGDGLAEHHDDRDARRRGVSHQRIEDVGDQRASWKH